MQVEIKIDKTCDEPRVLILTDRVTDEVNELLKRLSDTQVQAIAGFRNNSLEILEPDQIVRICTENQKVYAQTEGAKYLVKLRLYELEERLNKTVFVRISNSEIINLKKVVNMDLSYSGTICVKLLGHITTFVSRRYIAKIKQVLGI
ncbi:MAG: LytTR family DNA-binding domain-containing protein [Acetanaerobacterium sp.]